MGFFLPVNIGLRTSYLRLFIIPPRAVDDTLSFIIGNSGKGSTVIFDYYPQFLADGTSGLETEENIRNYIAMQGEPPLFGINEDDVEAFLS
jgi:O-methyltransferase involved in polyketide biosynthesis